MSGEHHFFLAFCGAAAVSLACGLLVWPLVSAVWPDVRDKIRRFLRLPLLAKVTLFAFVLGFIAYGSTKTNQVDQAGGMNVVGIVDGGTNDVDEVTSDGEVDGGDEPDGGGTNAQPLMLTALMPPTSDEPQTVSSEDIVRGWRLWEVRTNDCVSYAMPEGATLATNWWVRGAYEDVKRLDLGGGTGCEALPWRFPFGTNEYDSAWAFSWGKLRFALGDAASEIVAVGTPMAAVPYHSRLWTAVGTNGSRLVTWENFALGRDTNAPVNAQVELRTTGDFVARSNEVETVCLRVDPEDWDGDGWENDDDDDPYGWDEFSGEFCQDLPSGANEAAYYWIEIRPRWNSWIEFYGDGPSDLDDPCFWAKAGETYRVTLLIGKTYAVESSRPIDVVGRSSPSVEVDGDGTCALDVVWPVAMSAQESNGRGFRMVVLPSVLGGVFHWTNSCCTVYGSGIVFRFGCEWNCGCRGCCAHGYYEYDGYRLVAIGGWCGCPEYPDEDHDPRDDPYLVGASISFTKHAIIFEDGYANTTNDVVPWRSTETELVCMASGGANGGCVRFGISGDDGLVQYAGRSLPFERGLAPNESVCFTNRYRAVIASTRENEIEAVSYFSENQTGWTESGETHATAVRVEIQPMVYAPENECAFRHKFGIGERAVCRLFPITHQLSWVASGAGRVVDRNGRVEYYSAMRAENNGLKVVGYGVEYTPLISVVEPECVCAQNVGFRTLGLNAGHAGGILLTMTLHVSPMDVSFSGIAVEEVPDGEGTHSGYFADAFFMNEWYHGTRQQAGVWSSVFGQNQFLSDEAGISSELPQMDENGCVSLQGSCGWIGGELAWQVLCGWADTGVGSGDDPIGLFATNAWQVMTIDANGNCCVQKHSNSVRRMVNGQVFLNGERR